MVSFIEAIENGYKNMFVINGCATRAEYWWWVLYQDCVMIFISLISLSSIASYFDDIWLFIVILGWIIAHIIPNFTLRIRRLHDSDHSGWNLLWNFIPYIGIFFHLYFMLLPSNPFSDWREEEDMEN